MSPVDVQSGTVSVSLPGSSAANAFVCKSVSSKVMRRLEVDENLPETSTRVHVYPYVKRGIDIFVAAGVLVLLSPFLALMALCLWVKNGGVVIRQTPKMGCQCRLFHEYAFLTGQRFLRRLPVLLNVLKGDLSLVGPRAAKPGEMCADCLRTPLVRKRSAVRPGLLSDWWIRRHASLDYVQETLLDAGYVEAPTFRKDASILLRAIPGLATSFFWGEDPPDYSTQVKILNVCIDNVSMQSAIDRVVDLLAGVRARQVCFVNPHYINEACRLPQYKEALDHAGLVLADGFGTKLAGKILHRPIRQNLCGTDLFPRLCAALSDTGKSIYLLGAAPGAVDLVVEWVRVHYPGVTIKGSHHGYFGPEEEPEVIRQIAQSGADLLVVAMGVPKQELWIFQNLGQLNVKVAMGFGGLFDYFAGRVPRAPQWVREMGMEWVYRLIQEPRRMWRRYLIGNGVFLARVLHERLFPRAWKSLPSVNGIDE